MPAKSYAGVAAIIFLLVAIAQAVRAAMGFSVVIAGFSLPIYLSIVIAVVMGVLALVGFMVSR
jgi:uncharacterized integral membrane protein